MAAAAALRAKALGGTFDADLPKATRAERGLAIQVVSSCWLALKIHLTISLN